MSARAVKSAAGQITLAGGRTRLPETLVDSTQQGFRLQWRSIRQFDRLPLPAPPQFPIGWLRAQLMDAGAAKRKKQNLLWKPMDAEVLN